MRYPEIRLIQCLPISNKGLKEDFLIFSGGWHDGLPYPTKEGTLGGGPTVNLYALVCAFLSFPLILCSYRNALLLSLVNRASLDRILRSQVYINEANGQLRVAHLILGYTSITRAFQAPKCVIKARDPRLHRISVAYEGFVIPEGIPIPEGTPFTQPLPVASLSRQEYSHPRPFLRKRRKEKKKEQKKVLWT